MKKANRIIALLLVVLMLGGGILSTPTKAVSTASEIKSALDIILNRSPLKDATYTSFNNMGRGSGCYAYVYSVSLELFGVGIPSQAKNSYGYATALNANSNWKQVGSTASSSSAMISLLKTSQSGDIFQFGNQEVPNHIAVIYETTSTSITIYDTTSSKGLRIRTYNWTDATKICSFAYAGAGLSLYRCQKNTIVNTTSGGSASCSYAAAHGSHNWQTVKQSGVWCAKCAECGTVWDYQATFNNTDPQSTGIFTIKAQYFRDYPYQEANGSCLMENTVPIVGYVINAYQHKWYVTDTGLYIYEPNVEYKEPLKTCTGTNLATGNLAINSKPSSGNQITGGSIPSGAAVTVDPTKTASNGWLYVTYNGISGYSSGNLIALTDQNNNTGLKINDNGQTTISMAKGTVPTLPTISSNVNLSYVKVNIGARTSTTNRVMTNPGAKSVSLSSYSALTTGLKGLDVGTHDLWVAVMDVGGSAKTIRYTVKVTSTAPATYAISYNANGGTGAPAAQTKTAGVPLTLTTAVPARTGYKLLGWAESSSASAPQYHSGESFTKDAKTTLYAVWGKELEITGGTGTYALGSAVTISYSAGGVSEYTVEVYTESDNELVFSQTTTAKSVSFTPSKAGDYTFVVSAPFPNGVLYYYQWRYGDFTVVDKPKNHSVSTDKTTYLRGETVTITPSATGADYYAVSVWDGGDYGEGTNVYYNGHFTGSVSYRTETAGTYGILCNAFNEGGRVSAKTTFTVVDNILTAAVNADGSVALSWPDVNWNGYWGVFRNTEPTFVNANIISRPDGNVCSWVDTTAEPGTTYYYMVQPHTSSGAGVKSNSVQVTTPTPPEAPSFAAVYASGKVNVAWNPVDGATKYTLYRREYNGSWSSWAAVRTNLTGTSCTDSSIVIGTEYQYRMRAYNVMWSAYSDAVGVKTGITKPAAPDVTATFASGKVTVKWNAVSGASKYALYRREYGSSWSSWTAVSTSLTGTSYTDGSVAVGKVYQYRMKAYNGTWSDYSASAEVKVISKPASPVFTVAYEDGSMHVVWNAVSGAKKYALYRSCYKNGAWTSWTIVNTRLTGTSYTDTAVEEGYRYQYRMKAYNGLWSDYSANVNVYSVSVPLEAPSVAAAAGSGQITVVWGTVEGGVKYALYRAAYENGQWGKWSALNTTIKGSITSYMDKNVQSGVKYQYRMKVFNGLWSAYSTSVTVTAK